jgi:hypothetical protein
MPGGVIDNGASERTRSIDYSKTIDNILDEAAEHLDTVIRIVERAHERRRAERRG